MAQVLKLKKDDAGSELNFLAGQTGFQLAGQGWRPTVPAVVYGGEPYPVLETFNLHLKNTSHNNVAANMQTLHDFAILANAYITDRHNLTPIWLHAKLDNETTERRALVRDIQIQFATSWFGTEATGLEFPITVTILREPYWEQLTKITLPALVPSAAAVVVYDYTTGSGQDIVGDVGARISNFVLGSFTGTAYKRYFMGIRSANKHPNLGNFEPIWEVEDGDNFTDTTTTADAGASGGNKDVTSESALDWDIEAFRQVNVLSSDDVAVNEEDLHGTFLLLLRAKVTSGTWDVRTAISIGSASAVKWSDIVEISNTGWAYYEIDTMSIPFRNLQAIDPDLLDPTGVGTRFYLSIYARRTSGTGDLWTDCFGVIPIDEGFLKLSLNLAGSTDYTWFGHAPSGVKGTVRTLGTTTPSSLVDIQGIYNFVLPLGDGRIYLLYTRGIADTDTLSHTVSINPAGTTAGKIVQRWLSLAGSES